MKTVLITGASSGIGKATSQLFSEKGWNVAATMPNIEKSEIFKTNSNINSYEMDVTDSLSVEKCLEQVFQEYGKIDVLVNNAGIYDTEPFELISSEKISAIVKTNINGVITTTQKIIPHFRNKEKGMIINVSSVAGRLTFPYQTIYHSTKWAIEGLSEGLRYELTPLNITVKLVEPGMVKTNLYNLVQNKGLENYPDAYEGDFKKWHKYLMKNYDKGYQPVEDAKTIFKAANDGKNKLRYQTDFTSKMAIFLYSTLPINCFQKFIKAQVK